MYSYFDREWPIREELWIDRLGEDIHKRVLFVCGANHRETLRRRLESRGIEVKIVEKRSGASRMSESDFPAYKAAYKDLRRNGFLPIADA
jgi:ActR/RegA family two-component response regulator